MMPYRITSRVEQLQADDRQRDPGRDQTVACTRVTRPISRKQRMIVASPSRSRIRIRERDQSSRHTTTASPTAREPGRSTSRNRPATQ